MSRWFWIKQTLLTSTSTFDLRDLSSETREVQLVVSGHRHQHYVAGGDKGQMFAGRIVATHPVGDRVKHSFILCKSPFHDQQCFIRKVLKIETVGSFAITPK